MNICATQIPPWIEHPFRLISWLEMNKFSAHLFVNIGASMKWMQDALEEAEKDGADDTRRTREVLSDFASRMVGELDQIGCKLSAKAAKRIEQDCPSLNPSEMRARAREFQYLVFDEMSAHLFLWVPSHRAEFYGMDAVSLIGEQCCARFPSIQRELEEAAKCYAVGQYTACAFHLARSAEAGAQALAKAMSFIPSNHNWTLVFRQLGSEWKMPEKTRPPHWQTHGAFIENIWADMRAIAKVWRNDIVHLIDTYTEPEAKELLTVIPLLLRDLATKMDEKGKLY